MNNFLDDGQDTDMVTANFNIRRETETIMFYSIQSVQTIKNSKRIIRIFLCICLVLTLGTACSVPGTPVSTVTPTPVVITDQLVYDYMESIWNAYEAKHSVDTAEALVFIDTSDHFTLSLLEVARAYFHIQNKTMNLKISDAENDVLSIKRFSDIGFSQKDGAWYYENKAVNMGKQLPVPENMKPKQAEAGKEINVTMVVDTASRESNTTTIIISTNLPEGMQMMATLKNDSDSYHAQASQTVQDGKLVYLFKQTTSESYRLEVMSPSYSVQPDSVKQFIGENCKNLKGNLVTFDEVWGNSVEFNTVID